MKRLLKIFKWLLLIALFLLLGVSLLFYFKRNEIIGMVINQASQQLTAPVDVGKAEISFSKFPSAAIHLNQVFTAGNPEVGGDTLLYAESIYLQFDFWRILTGDISVERISVENGSLHIIRDMQNRFNYEIWQESESDEEAGLFAINRVLLLNMRCSYRDLPADVLVSGKINLADAEGDFTSELNINSKLQASLHQFNTDGESYLLEKTGLEGELKASYKNENFSLSSDLLKVNGNSQFALQYNYGPEQNKLLAWAKNQEIEPLLQFARQQAYIKGHDYAFSGRINAELEMLMGPAEEKMRLSFTSDDLDAEFTGYTRLENLKLNGQYSSSPGTNKLEINELALDEGEDFLSLKAIVTNLDYPQVEANVNANLPVADWISLLPLDTLQSGTGRARMDFSFNGKFRDLQKITARELDLARLSGHLLLEEGGFAFKNSGRVVSNINGELNLDNDNLDIKRLFFSSGQSDIYLQGRFGNVLNFLFFEGEKLAVNTLVKSQEIVLDEFIRDGEGENDEAYKLDFINNLDLRLQLEIGRLSFGNFHSRNLKGNLQVQAGEIIGSDLIMNADGGRYQGNFLLSPHQNNTYLLRAFLEADDIQMNSAFKSFNNFNQEAITAQNLQGQATIKANIGARMSQALVIDPASIDLVASVEILNGHLKNYEPLQALSRFAELKELEDVQFSKLANTISIHNSVITIPEMTISNNVLDLELSGTHDFDNNIDYIIRLKLSDILFAKRKQKNTGGEFDEHLAVADRGDDHVIPVAITGTIDQPEISISGKGFSESISEDLKKQGQQLKDLFKKDQKPDNQSGNGLIFEWDEG